MQGRNKRSSKYCTDRVNAKKEYKIILGYIKLKFGLLSFDGVFTFPTELLMRFISFNTACPS